MKKVFTTLSFLALWIAAYAQTNSVDMEYRRETGPFDSVFFMEARDYVFMKQVRTRSLFKVSLLGSLQEDGNFEPGSPFSLPFLSFEQKISPAFSVNTGFHFYGILEGGDGASFQVANIGLSVEPRAYLNMRRQIEAGERADNLSGNYLSLQLGYSHYQPAASRGLPHRNGYYSFLNFGMQRRLLKRGFIDIRAGLGASYNEEIDIAFNPETERLQILREDKWQPAFQLQAALGLAFGRGEPEEGRLCNALLCFREAGQMFRIDLIRLARRAGPGRYLGNLAVAYERKIGFSPFSLSLETEVELSAYDYTQFQGHELFWQVALEPRYYYNLRRRIAQGRSASNLSANYVTLRVSAGRSSFRQEQAVPERLETGNYNQFLAGPLWGIQRRIFRHGFFGYQLGVVFGREWDPAGPYSSTLVEVHSRLQVGLAF